MIDLSQMSARSLAELIGQASAELSKRLSDPLLERIQDERPDIVMREPSDDDKEFLLRIKTIVFSGGYVSAEERDRVADLAVNYGAWIKRQGLPTERGTGAWKKLAQFGRIKPAKER